MSKFRLAAFIGLGLSGCFTAGQALAWGSTGHRLIGQIAAEQLAPDLPAFLHTPHAIAEIGEISREPDRWRNAGKAHDSDRDPAHFIDLDDNGLTLSGKALKDLPATRSEFEASLRAAGVDPIKSGYLPYAILDSWQQLSKDFAIWRVIVAAQARIEDPGKRAWLAADRARREDLILRDFGVLSHYVGDASQPMHLSIHYNGWGEFPNPQGFTTAKIHVPLEGPYVRQVVTHDAVVAALPAREVCKGPLTPCINDYLNATQAEVVPLYALEKSGAFKTDKVDPRGRVYMTGRLAVAAAHLRDWAELAWAESKDAQIGYPMIKVSDVEAGRVDPMPTLMGDD